MDCWVIQVNDRPDRQQVATWEESATAFADHVRQVGSRALSQLRIRDFPTGLGVWKMDLTTWYGTRGGGTEEPDFLVVRVTKLLDLPSISGVI